MILADTSAWLEYDRATGSPVDQRMTQLIASDGRLAVTEPILMEVTAGARSHSWERDLRRLLLRFQLRPLQAAGDFDAATTIFRRCRAGGVTPGGLLDCLIAAVAWRYGDSVLAHDADFTRVAAVLRIVLDDATTPV